ncbi:MAG TPA: FHA domain-containing protein [Pyrinomonadaceae bacterium]|jgi:cbb3-type cytochrome oxidase subunit 3|nr:FHA domain-containing protein [Pyrinomonadaceae bacterium]
MQHSFAALGFQEAADSSTWIIIGVVLVLLFFIVVIVVVGLVIFFVMRKKSKAKAAAAVLAMPDQSAGEAIPAYSQEAMAAAPEVAVALDAPPPSFESPVPVEEIRSDVAEASPAVDSGSLDFDPSRTVAITRENTVTISYGFIKFVSGALSGQQFDVNPEGSYIGRESSLSQIVVPDPRISKRHMWIGVRDGLVRIVDQESRNGTFVNDPKSERITEATLTSGDTVILGESDVARFEYHA